MSLRTLVPLALLLVALPITLIAQDAPDIPDMAGAVAEVDSTFEDWDSTDTPGCAVGVAHDGQQLLTRAYGMADLEHHVPNTPSTIFEAGSVSKQFTTAAIILLAMDGELSLDDDVREYVPELPDYGETITIRHLMTHTSGLRDWGSVASVSGWGRSNRTHDHEHVIDILERQGALNFAPGERYSYSNSGYNLMAIIVSRVSDRSFAEFSEARIFEPLGMTSTEWRDDYTRIVEGRSQAYSGSAGDDTFSINQPIEHVHGNGGLLTTVGDLLIWNDALDTGRLGGGQFVEKMQDQGQLNNGREISYASGLRFGTDHGLTLINHTGATSGYRAFLGRYPEQDLSVSLLCNVTGVSPGSLGSRVGEVFLGDAAEEEDDALPEGVELSVEELEDKAGTYIDPVNHRPTTLEVEDDTLRIEGGTPLIPQSDTEFQVGTSDRMFVFESADQSARSAIQVTVEGYEEERLEPVAAFDPDEEALDAFTGTYYSEDAETTLHIEREEGELVAERRPDDDFEFSPAYTDAFEVSGLGIVRFFRDEEGTVTEFALSRGRIYDLRFHRE